jgi:hypothetical protein
MDEVAQLPLFVCVALFMSGAAALAGGLILDNVALAIGAVVMMGAGGFGTYAIFQVFR